MSEDNNEGFVVRDRRFWANPDEEREETTSVAIEEPTRARPEVDVEQLRAALAELENTKARLRRDAERQVELLRATLLESLIPVLDDLERSIQAAEGAKSVDALVEGVRLVQAQFLRTLVTFGLERVSTLGERFDPRLHDAVAVVPVTDAAQDGIVVDELTPAYKLGERIVRPAKVQVGRTADRQTA